MVTEQISFSDEDYAIYKNSYIKVLTMKLPGENGTFKIRTHREITLLEEDKILQGTTTSFCFFKKGMGRG